MSEQTQEIVTRLWTPEGFREDDWRHAESVEALDGRFILPLQAFLDLDTELRTTARERLGVLLLPGDAVEKIAPVPSPRPNCYAADMIFVARCVPRGRC